MQTICQPEANIGWFWTNLFINKELANAKIKTSQCNIILKTTWNAHFDTKTDNLTGITPTTTSD